MSQSQTPVCPASKASRRRCRSPLTSWSNRSRSASVRWRSVMSRNTSTAPTVAPDPSRIGAALSSTGLFVDDLKDFRQWPPRGVGREPAGQRFGYAVEEGHPACGVGGNDGVADAGKGDPQPFRLLLQLCCGPPAGRDVAEAPDPADVPPVDDLDPRK